MYHCRSSRQLNLSRALGAVCIVEVNEKKRTCKGKLDGLVCPKRVDMFPL